ncbi:MaoC family dehydratase N-terminal domain-containing protein [Chloroflexota bacterium]
MAEEVKMEQGILTDEMVQEMQGKIGLQLRTANSQNNAEATYYPLIKFADGIGDPNPLWHDEEYAQKTRYNNLVAHPSWVWTVLGGIQFGFRGLGTFHSGSDIRFYKPVYLGDKLRPECTFTGFDEPKADSKFSEGKTFFQHYENRYYNQKDELVAKIPFWVFTFERQKAKAKGKYTGKRETITIPHPWTEDELKKVEEEVLAEEIRGATTRYWEDVQVGEELTPVVKGPLGLSDMISFLIGGATPIPRLGAHSVQLRQYRRHPAWAFRDPDTYSLEPIFAVHYNKHAAASMAQPAAYDVGIERHCWLTHLLTNWIGDDGWIKRCYAEYRRFVYFSDVVWFQGKVTEKFIDDEGEPCVEIETHAINQRGQDCMPGHSTITLPSRDRGTWPLDSRLRK